MNLIDKINQKHVRPDVPEFRSGDIVRVDVWIKEGKKERIQAFEGIVTSIKGGSVSKRFTVRKKSGNVAVLRTFAVNSPLIDKITVVKKGMVRRKKLNFLKDMKKEYKVKERNSFSFFFCQLISEFLTNCHSIYYNCNRIVIL